jgi:hypothetical protein
MNAKNWGDYLAMAREDLAIAEAADAKREAYMRAADNIAAHIAATGDKPGAIAIALNTSRKTVQNLLRWRDEGFPEGTTPFTMTDPGGSKPTDRAAQSHARKVLSDPDQRDKVIAKLDPADAREVAEKIVANLDDDSRHEVRKAIFAKDDEASERARKDQRARGEEHGASFVAVEYNLLKRSLQKVDADLKRLLRQLDGVKWPQKTREAALQRVGVTSELIGLLRLVIDGDGEVDWDASLAALNEGNAQ